MAAKSTNSSYGCREAMFLIAEQLDEFTPTAELRLKHHLSHCPNCTAFFQSLRITIGLYRHSHPATLSRRTLNTDFIKTL